MKYPTTDCREIDITDETPNCDGEENIEPWEGK